MLCCIMIKYLPWNKNIAFMLKPILKWGGLLLVGVFTLLWIGMQIQNPKPLAAHRDDFHHKGIFPQEQWFHSSTGKLYSWYSPKANKPTLLLIHGSPGDWTAWKKFILETSVAEKFQLVVFDRPAFGWSTDPGGSLTQQSKSLKPLIEQFCHPCVVAGHSYGAALALQLAVDYPQHLSAVLSIAGTVAAPHQQPRWYNRLGNTTVGKFLMGKAFRASNREMLVLGEELAKLSPKFKAFSGPAHFIQGGNDVLVPAASASYIHNQWPWAEVFLYPDKNHFLIWTDLELVLHALHKIELDLD